MTAETIRASAPLRISFVGGGTDFPHYYERHGGAVLSATIDHAAHVSLAPRDDRQVRIRSLDLGHLVEYGLERGPEYDGVMDLPKAAIERMGVPTGIDVDIVSGVEDPAQRATLYGLAFAVVRADEQVGGAERIYLAQLAHLLGEIRIVASLVDDVVEALVQGWFPTRSATL